MIYLPVVVLFVYLLLDKWRIYHYRKSFKYVIHINGIRGKSSVVKMLDLVCRKAGYKTFSKITGTLPKYVDVKGKEYSLYRKGPAKIREYISIMKQAYHEGAEVLIVECMALSVDSQKASEYYLKADIAGIINVKTDHLEIMGHTHDEIREHLMKMTPTKGQLILPEEMKRKTQDGFHDDNLSMVYTISEIIGIEAYMDEVLDEYQVSNKTYDYNLINAFTMNDLESTVASYKLHEHYQPVLWFNDRGDRHMRSKMFLEWIRRLPSTKVFLTGDHVKKNQRLLSSYHELIDSEKDLEGQVVFGFGNIKGLERLL